MTQHRPLEAGTDPASAPEPALARLVAGARRSARDLLEVSLLGLEARRGRPYAPQPLPDGNERVYCYHVRKTGGTSLYRSFLALGGEDPLVVERRLGSSFLRRASSSGYVFAANQRRVLEQGTYFYGWSHHPAHRLHLPPRTFTVTVLRDPVRRVESYYSYLLSGDAPGTAFPVPEPERLRARGGFHGMLDVLPRRILLHQLYMFSPSFDVSEAVEGASRCSMVFFSEDYERGLAALARRLELPLRMRHDRVTGAKVELSAGEYDRLRTLLEPECEMIEQLRADGARQWPTAEPPAQ